MIALRDAYVTAFGALPGVRKAIAHDEDVNEAELKRIGSKATPVVYVVCLGTDPAEYATEGVATHRFAAVVAADRSAAAREDSASKGDLAAVIALRIAYELVVHDGLPEAAADALTRQSPTDVRTRNESGTDLARAGYSVWVATWRVQAPLTPEDVELVTRPLDAIHGSFTTPGSGKGEAGTVESETHTDFTGDDEP